MSETLVLPKLKTDIPPSDSFPDYIDPFEAYFDAMTVASPTPINKAVAKLATLQPSHGPSSQPLHFSVPLHPSDSNGSTNGQRYLRSATVGYVAPTFMGKMDQMKEGKVPELDIPTLAS